MEFGLQMRVMRVAKVLTLQDMAMITDIDISTLSKYERGLRPTAAHLNAILTGYGFPPEPLRGIAFGILEGSLDAAGLMQAALLVAAAEGQDQ